MGAIASQINSLTIVFSTVYLDTDQRKHQSSVSLASGEFPAQMTSNAENVSIWWRHHDDPSVLLEYDSDCSYLWCFHHKILVHYVSLMHIVVMLFAEYNYLITMTS